MFLFFDGIAYFIDEEDPDNPNNRVRGFKGGMDVGLVPLNGAGFDAQFITGKTESYNFFYLFIDVGFPMGVPVLPPILGLYGLSGLFGYNMTLDYANLIDYQGEANRPVMTDVTEWSYEEGSMAFGAGLTVGTLPDNAFTAKAKAVFAILIPGPVLLIEGETKILSYSDNYPFRVLAVLDVASGTLLMNITTTYAFPKASGDLLDISGSAEALFPIGDLSGWYLYLGQDNPESKRLKADVLSFFTAEAYFMIDQDGLAMGAWIGYSLDKKFAILKVVLESWISGALAVSWMPFQALGSLTWHGRAELSVGKVGLGISVEATASAEVPKPILLSGSVTVQLKTPIAKPKATIKITWDKEGTPPYPIPLSTQLGIEHRKVKESWDVTKSSLYNVDNDGLWLGTTMAQPTISADSLPLVPPDVMLVLNFDKPVHDAGIGLDAIVPPVESAGAYEFKYELVDIKLEFSEQWKTDPSQNNWRDFEAENSDYQLSAFWQALPDEDGLKNTKLMINATTSLEIARVLEDNTTWLYLLSLYNPDYPCPDPVEETWSIANVERFNAGEVVYPTFVENDWFFFALFPMKVDHYAHHPPSITKSLGIEDVLERFRCLLIPWRDVTPSQSLIVSDGVRIHACTSPAGFVQYQLDSFDDYPIVSELYINESARNVALNIDPARIDFPALLFPTGPDEVILNLMVDFQPNFTKIIARNGAGAMVDMIDEFSECGRNPARYTLTSAPGNPIRSIEFIGNNYAIKNMCWNEYEYAQTGRLFISMPEEMNRLRIYLAKGSTGKIIYLDQAEAAIREVPFNIPDDGTMSAVDPLELDVSDLSFRLLQIEGNFEFMQIAGLPQAVVDAQADYTERLTSIQTMIEENWGKHTAQILLPNCYYRLRVETTASRKKKTNSSWSSENFVEHMYFKTGDPAGIPDPTISASTGDLNPAAGTEQYPQQRATARPFSVCCRDDPAQCAPQ